MLAFCASVLQTFRLQHFVSRFSGRNVGFETTANSTKTPVHK